MYKMRGVVPPMITPFDAQGNVDFKALDALVDFLKDKVDGLFITGSYGCGALMNLEERKKVTEAVLARTKGCIDVIVMTGTTNDRDTVELTKHAYAAGATAVSSIAPFTLNTTLTMSAAFSPIWWMPSRPITRFMFITIPDSRGMHWIWIYCSG